METPYYLYDTKTLKRTLTTALNEASKYNFHIHYAIKANANKEIVREISNFGIGADCVSANEIELALEQNIPSGKIVFAGVGKTEEELRYAIGKDIFQINVESWGELDLIDRISREMGKFTDVALRISPEVEAKTHSKISTGLMRHKFGFYMEDINDLIVNGQAYKNINISGLHFHIGSQILDMEVFKELASIASKINTQFLENNYNIKTLNMGGGLGVDYCKHDTVPNFKEYFSIFETHLVRTPQQKVHFELGRSLVANSGSLITKVLYTKGNSLKNFVIVDAGMTDFLRPALYNAEHKIINLSSTEKPEKYDVVGPVCETSDVFAESVELNKSSPGDCIQIFSAGAYGEVMASNYNLRKKPRYLLA